MTHLEERLPGERDAAFAPLENHRILDAGSGVQPDIGTVGQGDPDPLTVGNRQGGHPVGDPVEGFPLHDISGHGNQRHKSGNPHRMSHDTLPERPYRVLCRPCGGFSVEGQPLEDELCGAELPAVCGVGIEPFFNFGLLLGSSLPAEEFEEHFVIHRNRNRFRVSINKAIQRAMFTPESGILPQINLFTYF